MPPAGQPIMYFRRDSDAFTQGEPLANQQQEDEKCKVLLKCKRGITNVVKS